MPLVATALKEAKRLVAGGLVDAEGDAGAGGRPGGGAPAGFATAAAPLAPASPPAAIGGKEKFSTSGRNGRRILKAELPHTTCGIPRLPAK